MVDLLDRKLLFVTGKGGVGKTTISAALGLLASSRGKRVLLCEMDAKGDLASSLETSRTTFEEREVLPGSLGHVDGHRGVLAPVLVPSTETGEGGGTSARWPGCSTSWLRQHRVSARS